MINNDNINNNNIRNNINNVNNNNNNINIVSKFKMGSGARSRPKYHYEGGPNIVTN